MFASRIGSRKGRGLGVTPPRMFFDIYALYFAYKCGVTLLSTTGATYNMQMYSQLLNKRGISINRRVGRISKI